MNQTHTRSQEVIDAIFEREFIPALDQQQFPIENLWRVVQGSGRGVAFSLPGDAERPAVKVNIAPESLTFMVNEQGPFMVTAAAIEQVIADRKSGLDQQG